MTVIAGIRTAEAVVLASDGYALHQDEDSAPVRKMDTYSKVRVLPDGPMAYAFAGSHEIGLSVTRGFEGMNFEDEAAFLSVIGEDLGRLNSEEERKQSAVLLAYLREGTPRLVLFPVEGAYEPLDQFAAVGPAADLAIECLERSWTPDLCPAEAVSVLVDAVYASSVTPTVNALPMLALVTSDGAVDLSTTTVQAYESFLAALKSSLVKRARESTGQHS